MPGDLLFKRTYLQEINMAKNTNRSVQKSDAVFVGWRKDLLGTPVAVYFTTAVDHPLFGSTVTEDTLREYNLQVPQIPPRRTWFGSTASEGKFNLNYPPIPPRQRGAK
jgi:hypothetical protein